MDSFRLKAARVSACLDMMWTLIWCHMALIAVLHANSIAKEKEECEGWKCPPSLLTSKVLFGNGKTSYRLVTSKIVFVIFYAGLIRFLTSVKLIYATGRNAAEVLKLSTGIWNWRTGDYVIMDAGVLYAFFTGNYILFGVSFVVRVILDVIASGFEEEVVKEVLGPNQKGVLKGTITGVIVQV